MQAPPPVSNLLLQLATMATNVKNILYRDGLDWRYSPDDGGWSIIEVLCHLSDVEREVHQARFSAILAEENAFLPGVSADEWAEIRNYRDQDGPETLASFLESRQDTLSMLENLPTVTWSRQGRHAFFGPTSLHEILFLVARHDDIHLEQLRNIIDEQLPVPTD